MHERPFTYSIILLTYNQQDTVVDAVQSALMQEGDPLEIVVSDDCSKDQTFARVQDLVAGYTGPHKVILNRNSVNLGLAGNIAKVHAMSSGDVLIAAAGDDISLPQRSAQIRAAFEVDHPPMLVCSYADVIDATGAPATSDYQGATLYHTTELARVARSKALYLGATGAWQRALYERYGPMEEAAYEDLVLGFRAALEGRVHVIKEALVKYRLGGGLTSGVNHAVDLAAFDAARLRNHVASAAVLRQRLKDCDTFGLDATSPVRKILKRAERKANLGRAFVARDWRTFWTLAATNPLEAISTAYAEQRRRRKAHARLVA